ncbi:MAG: energy transducer TonB [Bacteroidota bacterium]
MRTKNMIILAMFVFATIIGMACNPSAINENKTTGGDEEVVQPEYPGGVTAMTEFIIRNIKYPDEAKKNGVMGKVIVSFVVKSDGSVADVKAFKGIGSGCDEEAVRVIKLMPEWKPGTKDGKAVDVEMKLPIEFRLDEKK